MARASAFGLGLVYGNMKLKVLKVKILSCSIKTLEEFLIIVILSAMNLPYSISN